MHPDKSAPTAPRKVRCPACQGWSLFTPSNPWRPFCSERCQKIDLGAWANEEFRVPSASGPQDEAFGDPKRQDD